MDPFLIIVAVAIALFMFMQFRTAKKRRTEAANLQEKMVPGTEIMTNYGLYGTILAIDEDTNIATIETTPGTVLRIHRQTILKAVDDEVAAADDDIDDDAQTVGEAEVDTTESDAPSTPEFGERIAEVKKPARKSAKKDGE